MKENEKPSNPDLYKGQVSLLQDRVTLRDHFAVLAMQAFITNRSYQEGAKNSTTEGNMAMLSDACYSIADEMLKQREL